MKLQNNTIKRIASFNLCTGCGTCVAICPQKAIRMVINTKKSIYHPFIDANKCNHCSLCLNICPGEQVNFKELRLRIFGKQPDNDLLGNFLNCYTGYATEHRIRYLSASGGMITSLLIFALKEGIIDGAIVSRADKNTPIRPYSFIARTEEEIISAMSSNYCPVPVNIVIAELLTTTGHYAIVGLPCHIHGLRKAEQANNVLKEKILLHLGLVCNHVPTFRATEYLLRKHNVKNIITFKYRGKGWPGTASIQNMDGHEDLIAFSDSSYWGFAFQLFFWPQRCLVCDDKICELSDISFMDPWLPEFKNNEKIGSSLFITRTSFADQLLKKALDKRVILISVASLNLVKESQSLELVRRKVAARRMLFKMLHYRLPKYEGHLHGKIYFNNLMIELSLLILAYLGERSFKIINIVASGWELANKIKRIVWKN